MSTGHHDILVVGGGMVGAALALALVRGGLRVALVERNPVPPIALGEHDLRVSALNRAAQRFFESLDVWGRMAALRVSPYQAMEVWDSAGSGVIRFEAAELGEPDLGHIVENSVVQSALWAALHEVPALTWYCPAELAHLDVGARKVRATLSDGSRITASLVVAADGARSKVRELTGIEWRVHAYGQQAVVANVSTELPHQSTAWQRFLPAGPLAFLPLEDGRCSIVWSTSEEEALRLLSLKPEAFRAELGQALGYHLGAITDSGERAAYPLQGAQAGRYVQPRIALVGDAAHTIHPLAGQGANLGFRDAAELSGVLLSARGGDPGDLKALRRYERARRGENLLMMRAMEGFKLLFGSEQAPVRLVRNLGLDLTDRLTPVKHALMRRAMGVY